MKTSHHLEQLPSLYSKEHLKSTASLHKHNMGSLAELFDDEIKRKTYRNETKTFDSNNPPIQSLPMRTLSLADSSPVGFSTLTYLTPKTLKKLNLSKKVEKLEKCATLEKISDVKSTLQKYKAADHESITPSRADLKKTIQCLEILNENDSVMKGTLDLIVKVLKGSIYINPKTLEPYKEDLLGSENDELRKMILSCEHNYVPYYSLCMVLMSELAQQESRRINDKNRIQIEVDEIKVALEKSEKNTETLKEKLSKSITKDIYGQILEELKKVKEKCNSFFEENIQLKQKLKEMNDENIHLTDIYDKESIQFEKQISELNELRKVQEFILKSREKNVNELKKKITDLPSVFTVIIDGLENIRKQVLYLEQKVAELSIENERLNTRISASLIGELTPRPNYKLLQEEKKIGLTIFDPSGKNQIRSTSTIVEELMGKIADRNPELQSKAAIKIKNTSISLSPKPKSQTKPNLLTLPVKNVKMNSSPSTVGKSIFGKISPTTSTIGEDVAPLSSAREGQANQKKANIDQLYDFNEENINKEFKEDLIPKEYEIPSLHGLDNSTLEENGGQSHNSRYTLKVDITKSVKDNLETETIDSPEKLIKYMIQTKRNIEGIMTNL